MTRRAPEKREEDAGRLLMQNVLGFECWHLSQARATRQTPGWPDMLFMHEDSGLCVWWEAKAPGGKQSDAQREFQRYAQPCSMEYVVGPASALEEWAISKGLLERLPNGHLVRRRRLA
jgi:hypothetical protein